VERAGGVPILIPIFDDLDELQTLLPRLDGLLLSGGIDVDPRYYNEEPHPLLSETNPQLDMLEMTMARWAFRENTPTLGICRGMQVLNVALGGSLYQDLSALHPTSIKHALWDLPRTTIGHTVQVEPGSRMEQVLGTRELRANSLHHQAVKMPGKGVRISGRAGDGVVELIEVPNHRFMMGVQCHPEELYANEQAWANLFASFIGACVTPIVRTLEKVEQTISAGVGVV
jgi:putative glutamine amidotransferase